MIAILTSVNGLGSYIPALLLKKQIEQSTTEIVEVFVYEYFLTEQKQSELNKIKKAFQKDIRRARIGSKIAKFGNDLETSPKLKEFQGYLESLKVDKFVLVSGVWLEFISTYQALYDKEVSVVGIHLDAIEAPSWKRPQKGQEQIKHFELFNLDKNEISFDFKLDEIVEFEKRKKNIVVHGGGWHLGDYLKYVEELENKQYKTNIIVPENITTIKPTTNRRVFFMDKDWNPLEENKELGFPPFFERLASNKKSSNLQTGKEYHYLYYMIKNSQAIVSKPGGATLLDSLLTATPIIFLEGIGGHEKANQKLWENLGLGVSFDQWCQTEDTDKLLNAMHENLTNLMHQERNLTENIIKYLTNLK